MPCVALPAMLQSYRWSSLCPKLSTIVINCSNISQCQGIIDVLYSDKVLPFWSLICNHQVDVVPCDRLETASTDNDNMCKNIKETRKVGFEVNMQLATKSADGPVITRGLVACISRCCGFDLVSHTTLFIRHLNLSQSSITDSCLSECFPLIPQVEVIDCRHCVNLVAPFVAKLSPHHKQLHTVLLDGCWHIDEHLLLEFVASMTSDDGGGLFIDMLHEEVPLRCRGEVVILTAPHRGEWVRCTVVSKASDAITPLNASGQLSLCEGGNNVVNKYTTYGIYVWETLKFDHAVGFSNALVGNIARKHLRFVV